MPPKEALELTSNFLMTAQLFTLNYFIIAWISLLQHQQATNHITFKMTMDICWSSRHIQQLLQWCIRIHKKKKNVVLYSLVCLVKIRSILPSLSHFVMNSQSVSIHKYCLLSSPSLYLSVGDDLPVLNIEKETLLPHKGNFVYGIHVCRV